MKSQAEIKAEFNEAYRLYRLFEQAGVPHKYQYDQVKARIVNFDATDCTVYAAGIARIYVGFETRRHYRVYPKRGLREMENRAKHAIEWANRKRYMLVDCDNGYTPVIKSDHAMEFLDELTVLYDSLDTDNARDSFWNGGYQVYLTDNCHFECYPADFIAALWYVVESWYGGDDLTYADFCKINVWYTPSPLGYDDLLSENFEDELYCYNFICDQYGFDHYEGSESEEAQWSDYTCKYCGEKLTTHWDCVNPSCLGIPY